MDGVSPREGRGTEGQGLNRVTKSSRWVQRPVRTDKGRSWLALQPSPHDLIPQHRDGASKTLGQLKGQLVLSGQRGSFLQAEKLALCPKGGQIRPLLSLSLPGLTEPRLGQLPGKSYAVL